MESTAAARDGHHFQATSPPAAPAPGQGPAAPDSSAGHKRTYQACLPCRQRKVRCDLGSVDAPGDPPCQRCRREKKQCVFSETRRKRKTDDDEHDHEEQDANAPANKRPSTGGYEAPHFHRQVELNDPEHIARVRQSITTQYSSDSNYRIESKGGVELFGEPVINQQDALGMLVHAATKQQYSEEQNMTQTQPGSHNDNLSNNGLIMPGTAQAIDPALMGVQGQAVDPNDPDVVNGLKAWSSLRFVKAGWFTVPEGIAYIGHFFEHLAPLTPINIPDFRELKTHGRLLTEEPMLAVTLLTIASRYLKLKGPGAASRRFTIHDQLWKYLQSMIMRMFWGQEQFGGGFCHAGGEVRSAQELEARRRGLRSMGSVESLLLLSDWLPRGMHFNPSNDDGELLVSIKSDKPSFNVAPNPQAAWTEPAVRADRMCWSLVSMAYTIAIELGVFDSILDSGIWTPGPQPKTAYAPECADCLGRMLFVYVTQTCGRLVFPNIMPSQGKGIDTFLKMDEPVGTLTSPYGKITPEDRIQRAWAELTTLIRASNAEMFGSRERTLESTRNGEYLPFLERFWPRLRQWLEKFENSEITGPPATVIMIEFEHARMFINSLALQAVLEKAVASKHEPDAEKPAESNTPPAFFATEVRRFHARNMVYIKEAIDGARAILTMAIDVLWPSGGLTHAPARTFFRILGAAVFLLKSIPLGGRESEIMKSLGLLKALVEAFRGSAPDDVHLSLRVADLLEILLLGIKRRIVRLIVPQRSSNGGAHAGASKSPAADRDRRPGSRNGTGPGITSSMRDSFANAGLEPPRFVNVNDPNVTIMAPVDFPAHDGADDPFYTRGANARAPQTPTSTSAGMDFYSPQSETFAPSNPLNPTSGGHQRNFSTGTSAPSPDGYPWLGVDFQHMLDDGLSPGSLLGTRQAGPAANAAATLAPDVLSTEYRATLAGGGPYNGALGGYGGGLSGILSPFTGGAAGPEIASGVEFMAALGGWGTSGAAVDGMDGAPAGPAATAGGNPAPWNGGENGAGDVGMVE